MKTVYENCYYCDGHGIVAQYSPYGLEGERECPKCDGSGRQRKRDKRGRFAPATEPATKKAAP